jgi:hypothetical protein
MDLSSQVNDALGMATADHAAKSKAGYEGLAIMAAARIRNEYQAYCQYQAAVGPYATNAGYQTWKAQLRWLRQAQPRVALFWRQPPTQQQIDWLWAQHLQQY